MSSINEFISSKQRLSIFEPLNSSGGGNSLQLSKSNCNALLKTPIGLRNVATRNEMFDTLHYKADEVCVIFQKKFFI